jgi:uncharacterized protein YecE (DUF72 family)
MTRHSSLCIGTSGWHYDHWKDVFYPNDLSKANWLSYYSKHLNTVEINNSFYQLPSTDTLQQWKQTVPDSFVFSMKASRYITHMKKLKDPESSLKKFIKAADPLDNRLKVLLFQLPPKWRRNVDRLNAFLDALPDSYQSVFEFRDPSWWHEDVYDLLNTHGAGFVIFDLKGQTSPHTVTSDLVYIRLHGPSDQPYTGSYTPQALTAWRDRMLQWQSEGRSVYCIFDNDDRGYAVKNALELVHLVETAGPGH